VRHHEANTKKEGCGHRDSPGKQQVGDQRGCDPLGQGNEEGSVRPQYGTWRQRPYHAMQVSLSEEGQEEAIPCKPFTECFLLVLDRCGNKTLPLLPPLSASPYSDPGHCNGTYSHF